MKVRLRSDWTDDQFRACFNDGFLDNHLHQLKKHTFTVRQERQSLRQIGEWIWEVVSVELDPGTETVWHITIPSDAFDEVIEDPIDEALEMVVAKANAGEIPSMDEQFRQEYECNFVDQDFSTLHDSHWYEKGVLRS